MHGKFLAIQQNQRNSILFHETIPLSNIMAINYKVYFCYFENHIRLVVHTFTRYFYFVTTALGFYK
jgi:hypothetical protein